MLARSDSLMMDVEKTNRSLAAHNEDELYFERGEVIEPSSNPHVDGGIVDLDTADPDGEILYAMKDDKDSLNSDGTFKSDNLVEGNPPAQGQFDTQHFVRNLSGLNSEGVYVPPALHCGSMCYQHPERCGLKPYPYRCHTCILSTLCLESPTAGDTNCIRSTSPVCNGEAVLLAQIEEAASSDCETSRPFEDQHISGSQTDSPGLGNSSRSTSPGAQEVVELLETQQSAVAAASCDTFLNDLPLHTISHSYGWTPINCHCGCLVTGSKLQSFNYLKDTSDRNTAEDTSPTTS